MTAAQHCDQVGHLRYAGRRSLPWRAEMQDQPLGPYTSGYIYQNTAPHLELNWHPEPGCQRRRFGRDEHEACIREHIHVCGACYCDERQHNDSQRSMQLSSLLQ